MAFDRNGYWRWELNPYITTLQAVVLLDAHMNVS